MPQYIKAHSRGKEIAEYLNSLEPPIFPVPIPPKMIVHAVAADEFGPYLKVGHARYLTTEAIEAWAVRKVNAHLDAQDVSV